MNKIGEGSCYPLALCETLNVTKNVRKMFASDKSRSETKASCLRFSSLHRQSGVFAVEKVLFYCAMNKSLKIAGLGWV
jgi:hypothetical protein